MKKTYFCLISGFVFLLSTILYAATIHVPSDQPTIQAGIDAASAGDTVLVANGTYTGSNNKNLDYRGKDIVLGSEHGPEYTVIDCENEGRGVYFHSRESSNTIFEGFTIRNGFVTGNYPDGCGGGIYCQSSSALIQQCRISDNQAEKRGGGIGTYESGNPIIRDCIVESNIAEGGGGIWIGDNTSPTVEDCTIIDNQANCEGYLNLGGGGIFCTWASGSVSRCLLMNNKAVMCSGGVTCYHCDDRITITNSILSKNDTGTGHGGGVYLHHSSPAISNCTITENMVSSGGGLTCYYYSDPTVINSIIWNNDAPEEIYLKPGYPTNPIVTYSDIEGGWEGEGNIDADPLFIDPENDDFHLSFESPCIDAGTDAGVYEDIDGDIRPQRDGFDMGADEVREDGPVVQISPRSFAAQGFCGSQIDEDTLSIGSIGTESLLYMVTPGSQSWLALGGKLKGRLVPGNTAKVILNFDISGILPGIYEDTITVYSNDPYQKISSVPVHLEILSPITIEATCENPSVRRGESLDFDVRIESISEEFLTFDVWLDLYLTGGEPHPENPQYGPFEMTLGPGGVIEQSYSTPPIPQEAPLGGPYSLCLCAGLSPVKVTEDCFEFYIVP